jgi:hypothetical protein
LTVACGYSAHGISAFAHATSAAPRAWPTESAVRASAPTYDSERHRLGPVPHQQLRDLVVDPLQPLLWLLARRGAEPAEVERDQARPVPADDAVAARCRARVDAEDRHNVRLGIAPDVPPFE